VSAHEGQQVRGVDVANVTAWFDANVADVTPPLDFELIAGGHSNLTFRVTDAAGRRYVLRRPPLGHVLATAHDMSREHRIISALGPTDVPVATALGLCTDDSVNGAPFYVMDFVDGHVLRDAATASAALDEAGRRRAGESIVEVLARIHAVDWRTELAGWEQPRDLLTEIRFWDPILAKAAEPEWVAIGEGVRDLLLERQPADPVIGLFHGDFQTNNILFDDAPPDPLRITAVLDWEISG
jgi:aminoglycoside phosphotransferase (APT) family kinase protein